MLYNPKRICYYINTICKNDCKITYFGGPIMGKKLNCVSAHTKSNGTKVKAYRRRTPKK